MNGTADRCPVYLPVRRAETPRCDQRECRTANHKQNPPPSTSLRREL